MKKTISFAAVLLSFSVVLIYTGSRNVIHAKPSLSDEKITPKELVARHLESIGSAESRKALRSLTVGGTSQAVFKGRGEGRADGIVVLASQAEKSMIGMKFNNPEYPYERMGYDGDGFTVGFVRPGEYTVLGQFLRLNEKTFRSGILGGTLSTAWELLSYDESRGRLKSAGKTKIDGVELLKFDYNIRKGSDMDITMFFDAKTFRHVRTEYKRVISGGQGLSVDTSSRQNEVRYKMIEEFSDFKEESNLMLPHAYNIDLEIISGRGTVSYSWKMELRQFVFNQAIDASEFRFGTQ